MVSEIGAFAAGGGGDLSGASRTILEAIREVHLKIDTPEKHARFHDEEAQFLLVGPTGALKSGRVVARVTTIRLMTPWDSKVCMEKHYRS